MPFKLNYKLGKRITHHVTSQTPDGQPMKLDMDTIPIEWTHASGPIKDYAMIPKGCPPDITYEKKCVGERKVIADQITVKSGTPDSVVMQMCEEKRAALAKNLEVEV